MKPEDRLTIEPDIAMDLRTVSAATSLSEVYQVTRRDGRAISPSQEIDLLRNAVVGALVVLWGYAEKHLDEDNTLSIPSKSIDTLVRLEGFRQAVSRQWLDEVDEGVILPGYREKNPLIATKKRSIKFQPNAAIARPAEANGHLHDAYSTRDDNSYYIPREPLDATPVLTAGVQNDVSVQEVSELKPAATPMLDVSLLYIGDGEEGNKSKRGCGGEREKGETGKDIHLQNRSREADQHRTTKKRAKSLPADFALTLAMREYAQSRCPDCDVDAWFERFCSHHLAHGKVMVDWVAAWRTWVGNGKQYGYPKLTRSDGLYGLPVLNG